MNSKKGGNTQEALKGWQGVVPDLCLEHSGCGERETESNTVNGKDLAQPSIFGPWPWVLYDPEK